jgi:hypothetical protein
VSQAAVWDGRRVRAPGLQEIRLDVLAAGSFFACQVEAGV